jgi:hypothetical protein
MAEKHKRSVQSITTLTSEERKEYTNGRSHGETGTNNLKATNKVPTPQVELGWCDAQLSENGTRQV